MLRTEHMRRALALAAVFATTLVITLGITFWYLRADAVAMIERDLQQSVAALTAAGDRTDFGRLLDAEIVVANPAERIFIFIDGDGGQTGNATVRLDGDEPVFSSLTASNAVSDADYRTVVEPIFGGVLVVARSYAPIMRLAETFLALIALTVIPTTLIAVGSAVAINTQSSRRLVRISSALEHMTRGDLSARVGSSGDDDIGHIEAAIDRMASAQEDAVTALRQVTADIAHELRTPLQRISVHLSDISEETDQTARRELVEKALDETHRSVAVFQSLLQIAQIEGGDSGVRLERFDATSLLANLAELYRPAAEDAGIRLTGPVSPPRIWLSGDERLIGQAVANLFENALRHAGEGREIICGIERLNGTVAITVADKGSGIPQEEQEKVLERLYRLEHSRTTPGSGLGLSLVKATVEAHGGTIRLEDNSPGLRCTLNFPASDSDLGA